MLWDGPCVQRRLQKIGVLLSKMEASHTKESRRSFASGCAPAQPRLLLPAADLRSDRQLLHSTSAPPTGSVTEGEAHDYSRLLCLLQRVKGLYNLEQIPGSSIRPLHNRPEEQNSVRISQLWCLVDLSESRTGNNMTVLRVLA